jgi:hypothetical protein
MLATARAILANGAQQLVMVLATAHKAIQQWQLEHLLVLLKETGQ